MYKYINVCMDLCMYREWLEGYTLNFNIDYFRKMKMG